jgi:hypothetical protein
VKKLNVSEKNWVILRNTEIHTKRIKNEFAIKLT